jgi:hypothetical protein
MGNSGYADYDGGPAVGTGRLPRCYMTALTLSLVRGQAIRKFCRAESSGAVGHCAASSGTVVPPHLASHPAIR